MESIVGITALSAAMIHSFIMSVYVAPLQQSSQRCQLQVNKLKKPRPKARLELSSSDVVVSQFRWEIVPDS